MLRAWLKKWGDATLAAESERLAAAVALLREELDQAKVTIRVQAVEIEGQAAVIARNIKRTEAETAAAARAIADAER